MKKILVIVHQSTSDPGLVGQVLQEQGYQLERRVPSEGDSLPPTMDNYEAAIIFGGPMSANDCSTLPFIRQELDWIPIALDSGKPLLGICLGAQLLARVLGATITPHPEGKVEIGYFPIVPTAAGNQYFTNPLHVYHWHSEGFDLPKGAVKLAGGDTFVNQAFSYNERVVGVQFHPEMTDKLLRRWTRKGVEQLTLPGAQSREEQLKQHAIHAPAMDVWLRGFLKEWLESKARTSLVKAS